MSSSRKITLKSKLSALVIFFIATLLLVGTLAMQQLWNISRQQRAMFTDTVVPVRIVVDAARQGATHFRRMYVYIWKEDRQARDNELRLNAESEQSVLAAMQMLQTGSSDAGLKELGAKLQDTWASYKQALLKVQEMADRSDPGAMQELHESPARLHVAVRTLLLDASKRQEDLARQDTENAARDVERTFWLLTSLILACALISSVLGVWLVRSIMRQLGGEPAYAAEIAQEVAKGNLAIQVQLKAADRGSVLANMEAMRAHLAQLVRQVRQSSESIATGSNQIASGNSDLSQRTEEQASNLAQTAASMEQMNATVKQNLDAVHTASTLAVSARDTAARGGTVMGDVVSTMQAITASSRKVEDIVGVIDSIAFQTNILALNAAVEAARAGEQGRGFAVVASEVRALAQRSAEAAKEIKQLIGASVGEVGAGSRLVSEAGVTMQDIVDQVRQVAVLIADIGSAAQEQVQGISQVSDAVNQLDQVTQQNAALVEESAAAANSLSTQAAKLVELVGVFQLSGEPASLPDSAHSPAHALPLRTASTAATAPRPAVAQAGRRPAPAVRQLPPASEGADWEKF